MEIKNDPRAGILFGVNGHAGPITEGCRRGAHATGVTLVLSYVDLAAFYKARNLLL